jgi:TRAP-type C4-dicarboxylate transport system permease small subunit
MKPVRIQIVVMLLLCAGFLGCWAWSGSQLPPRVATHFDASGQPDGWMNRESHQKFMLLFGLAFPLVMPVMFYLTRFLPPSLINIPHRNYWLAPERRRETADYLFGHGLWLGCLAVLFVTGIQYSIVLANRQTPPELPVTLMVVTLAPFVAGMLVSVVMMLRHFRRKP